MFIHFCMVYDDYNPRLNRIRQLTDYILSDPVSKKYFLNVIFKMN